jgi:hypothetical protein
MHEEIKIRLDKMEEGRTDFMKAIENWSEEQLRFKPAEAWNAMQVMEHIIFSETGTLGYLKKKTSSGFDGIETSGIENQQNGDALKKRLESSDQYKAPATLPAPTGNLTMEEMTKGWDEARIGLTEFLQSFPAEHFDKLVFRHPIAGPINVLHTLDFLGYHIGHHLHQIERIKQSQS